MNNQKQIIGNGPEVHTRSFSGTPYQGDSFFGGQYPGLGGNPYSDFTQGGGPPVPFEGGGLTGGISSSSSSNLLSGLNMNQIKGFVDRMGGIEGIIGTMTKVQKFMASFQQMAPLLKVIFNSFGSGKVKSTDVDFNEVPRRRKRRKRSGSTNRKYVKSSSPRLIRK